MRLQLHHEHPWDVTPAAAIVIQKKLARYVVCSDRFADIRTVAGIDVGFEDAGRTTRAAVVVLDYPSLTLLDSNIAKLPTRFPYVPGLLSFRELPAVLQALAGMRRLPDLVLCDGQGYAHPRRCGLAAHLGVLTDIPAIGVGKTRLLGTHAAVSSRRSSWQPLMDKDETVGAVLRTRQGVKPVYVSIGHRITLASALRYVLACAPRYKLPEPTRLAHRYASQV